MMDNIKKKIPVILDTDIGDDIDDTWALIMLLNSPEIEVKLICSAVANTTEKACLLAKLLEIAGRTDIPIGIGVPTDMEHVCNQAEWVKGYSLDDYPGTIYHDGIDAIIKTIRESEEQVTLCCIGPLANIGEVLRRAPDIAKNARFVGMHGSIYQGYTEGTPPCAETNVRFHTDDCQLVFQTDWEKVITPLDTCGMVTLNGDDYKSIVNSQNPILQALMENNKLFAENASWLENYEWQEYSSTLFDTVAIFLIYSNDFLKLEELPIVVSNDGMTIISEQGNRVKCAVSWSNIDEFKQHLLSRIK